MANSNKGLEPAELPQKKPVPSHSGPMSEQGSMGGHGHEMHPQKFLQLIGSHVAPTTKQKTSPRWRVTL